MSDQVTKDDWKSSLDLFLSRRGTYTDDETLRKNLELVDDFIRFAELDGMILDVGCGSGDLRGYVDLEDYVGIDPIEPPTCVFPFVQGIGEFLPFKDGSFDCTVVKATLDHCWSPERVMFECDRVLKRNGRVFVWLKVTRTSIRYKLRKMLHYIAVLDFASLVVSIKSNVSSLGRGDTGIRRHGHTRSFTDSDLFELVSSSFDIAKVSWHDQDAFMIGRKRPSD